MLLFMLPCMWKQTFGFDCMGCGFQRSLVALFHGELLESLQLYPATIPMILLFALLFAHLKFRFRHGAAILLWWFIGTAAIMLVSWLLKLADLI